MDAAEMLALADNWMGEGMELARRVLALADDLDQRANRETDDRAASSYDHAADLIREVVRKEWNPLEQPR